MTRRGVLPGAPARTWGTRRAFVALAAVTCLAVVAIVGVAVHGEAGGGSHGAAGASRPTAAPGTVASTAVRWWSVPGAARGSRIDAADPRAVAATLAPSREAYCSVLRQTVTAGRPLLPTTAADDPALQVTATAFVSELSALAPRSLDAAWRILGRAVLALVGSGGTVADVDRSALAGMAAASRQIATDARAACHVELAGRS